MMIGPSESEGEEMSNDVDQTWCPNFLVIAAGCALFIAEDYYEADGWISFVQAYFLEEGGVSISDALSGWNVSDFTGPVRPEGGVGAFTIIQLGDNARERYKILLSAQEEMAEKEMKESSDA